LVCGNGKDTLLWHEPKEVKTAVVVRALWIFDRALRLMHPVMPFISEELWQNLTDRKGQSLMRAAFPIVDEHYINQTVEDELNFRHQSC
jgi:valyl-tRNA synthetase